MQLLGGGLLCTYFTILSNRVAMYQQYQNNASSVTL